MAESYEEIVRKWYVKLRPNFINLLMDKYRLTQMTLEDAENIYQDIFLVIRDNLDNGKIKENTSWNSYIMRVGLNLASKQYRQIGKVDSVDETDNESPSRLMAKIDDMLKEIPDEQDNIYSNPRAQEVLRDELTHTPEPCASIIKLTYFSGLKDAEIIEELDRFNSANAVKARRWQCMRDLIRRVNIALFYAGLIDKLPTT